VKPRRPRLKTARAFSITVPRIAHGYSSHLIITLYPTGAIEIAEARHRESPVLLDLARLYVESRIADARRKLSNR
jgi:hypothetical protein